MKTYTIIKTRKGKTTETTGTMPELVEYFGYTLKAGASYNGQKGCKKVNDHPKTIKSLMTALQNAVYNTQGSCYEQDSYDYTEAVTEATTTTKKPRAKKAAKPTTIKVVLKAFTGMKIAIYTGTLKDSTITITTKNGKEMAFNLDGTQKTQKPGQNPKFNNRIEIVTEA